MTRLLDKSFKSFLAYTAIVLACSIPAYFVIVDWIWQHELKEHNIMVSTGIRHHLKSLALNDAALAESLSLWNKLQPEKQIAVVAQPGTDSTYNCYRRNELTSHKNFDRFQGLVSYFDLSGKHYRITVETNMEESYETMLGLAMVAVLFFILLLIGLILINRRLSARIWKPFNLSLERIAAFDLNKQREVAFEETDIKEFDDLNRSLTRLIAGNIAAYQQQKHFIENASHELQTPLAIVQSKLDVLLQDESLTGRQSANISQAQLAMARVNRINKNLLLLAKIEHNQFADKELVDLSLLLEDTLQLMHVFFEEKQMQIRAEVLPGLHFTGNKVLMEMLLSNLFQNAIRYSPPQSVVSVKLDENGLSVSNPGTTALRAANLFTRFGRAANEAPATGLGLSIVQQICMQQGWQVRYHFAEQQHTFLVAFPA